MRILVVAEKDTVGLALAEAIFAPGYQKFADHVPGRIGNDELVITWPNGHAFALADPVRYNRTWGQPWREEVLPVSPPNDEFVYVPTKPRFVERFADWFWQADQLVNACDAGREGELIGHELLQHCGGLRDKMTLRRMWITSVTPSALRNAWEERSNGLNQRFEDLRESAMARQQADWLWGINFTRKVTLAFGKRYPRENGSTTFHIGRVQTPVLKLVADRSDRVEKFTPDHFYRIEADFMGSQGRFSAKVVAFPEMRFGGHDTHFRRYIDAIEVRKLLVQQLQMPWDVQDAKREVLSPPPAPFNLDELQRAANMIPNLRFTAKETLDLAQRLYHDERAISYPRTDSTHFPEEDAERVLAIRADLWQRWAVASFKGLDEIPADDIVQRWFDDTKVSDHHAIMPTGIIPEPIDHRDGRIRREFLLWQLITMRFLQAWLPDAHILAASRVLLRPLDEAKTKYLRAILECAPVVVPGWMEVEDRTFNTRGCGMTLESARKARLFPDCETGGAKLQTVRVMTGTTTKPEYHDDAMLIRDMNEGGLGTPATRARCIEDLIERQYVGRTQHGRMHVTPDGRKLLAIINEAGASRLCDVTLTASWEKLLGRMEKRVRERPTRRTFLEGINEQIREIIGEIDGRQAEVSIVFCPDSGQKVTLSEDSKKWLFGGKYRAADCYRNLRGREMLAEDYRDIFVAGAKGGGPFNFKRRADGVEYEAWVVWRSKRRGAEQWEYRFKRGGRDTRSRPPSGGYGPRPAA